MAEYNALVLLVRRTELELHPDERAAVEKAFPGRAVVFRRIDPYDANEYRSMCHDLRPDLVLLHPIPTQALAIADGVTHVMLSGGTLQRIVSVEPKLAPFEPVKKADPDLLYKIGLEVIERGRVSITLLQQTFHLGFDAAAAAIEELQRHGVVGPYLGGQRRDILLTKEAWEAKWTRAKRVTAL